MKTEDAEELIMAPAHRLVELSKPLSTAARRLPKAIVNKYFSYADQFKEELTQLSTELINQSPSRKHAPELFDQFYKTKFGLFSARLNFLIFLRKDIESYNGNAFQLLSKMLRRLSSLTRSISEASKNTTDATYLDELQQLHEKIDGCLQVNQRRYVTKATQPQHSPLNVGVVDGICKAFNDIANLMFLTIETAILRTPVLQMETLGARLLNVVKDKEAAILQARLEQACSEVLQEEKTMTFSKKPQPASASPVTASTVPPNTPERKTKHDI